MSKDRDGAELGIDRQEAECRAFVEEHRGVVTNVSPGNDKSAMSGKVRPRLARLPRDLDRVIDLALLGYELDGEMPGTLLEAAYLAGEPLPDEGPGGCRVSMTVRWAPPQPLRAS